MRRVGWGVCERICVEDFFFLGIGRGLEWGEMVHGDMESRFCKVGWRAFGGEYGGSDDRLCPKDDKPAKDSTFRRATE